MNIAKFLRTAFLYRTPPVAASKQLSSILEILFNLESFVAVSVFPVFYLFYQVHIIVQRELSIEK